MIEVCDKDLCSGCSACANICSRNAISMEEITPHGYLYPIVNKDLCIDCGLCSKVCPVNQSPEFRYPLKAFAAISNNHADLITSSSGGASSVFASYIVKNGGVVYGAVEEDYSNISHQRIEHLNDLYKIKGSKYVHSYTTQSYQQVKLDLQRGITVLFYGTPCQISGLLKYLRKPYENLITIDLCCHGVPSQKFLKDDISEIVRRLKDRSRYDSHNIYVDFRNKGDMTRPWNRYGLYMNFNKSKDNVNKSNSENGYNFTKSQTIVVPFLKDNYITAFMAGLIFRESCYTCLYARPERVSDITIADFWGYQGNEIFTDDGISLIMPSSNKGMKLFDDCKLFLCYEERPLSEAIAGNGQLNSPSARPIERDLFLKLYSMNMCKAYSKTLRRYIMSYKCKIMKHEIKQILRIIKNIVFNKI